MGMKKLWHSLAALFFVFTVGFAYPVVHYEVLIPGPLTSDAAFIVLNMRYYTFLTLAAISGMAAWVCFICGLHEK